MFVNIPEEKKLEFIEQANKINGLYNSGDVFLYVTLLALEAKEEGLKSSELLDIIIKNNKKSE